MAKVYFLRCRDVGVDCDFEARGASLDDVIEQCAQHGTEQHGMKGFGPELYSKMRSHLQVVDEPAAERTNPGPG